jgi:hypothetical protein
MLKAISVPLQDLCVEDLKELYSRAWPESQNIEYKGRLPADKGRTDGWYSDGEISEYAKQKIFKEIVAFANSSGGRLFLGIDESSEKPPSATGIREIPRCHDLAERLLRAASDWIEPPINALDARAITTNNDGGGVIVFDVPSSHSAPHRHKNLSCYVRRGTESRPMTMYEIQDLTLRLNRRIDEINARFIERQEGFLRWLHEGKPITHHFVGFRATAVPIGSPVYVDRVFHNPEVFRPIEDISAYLDGDPKQKITLSAPWRGGGERPIVRGSRRECFDSNKGEYFSVYCNGVIEYGDKRYWSASSENRIYLGWVLGAAANVILAAESFNAAAKAPGSSYAIEVELASGYSDGFNPVRIFGLAGYEIGTVDTRLVLERLSIGDTNRVLSVVHQDICDGCGLREPKAPSIMLEAHP